MFEVDYIVVVKNQFDFTKKCIESIFRCAEKYFHLIVVDNASNDATPEYLSKIEQREFANSKVTVVRNSKNEGYAVGLNQGLEHSSSAYVVLCNNDIEFFPDAVNEMIRIAQAQKEIGLVNPNSNEFGLLGIYDKIAIDAGKGTRIERCHTSGFCVLVKREVIQKIGGIDTDFSPAYFEDMDLAERAKRAGFICVMAYGAYVHHYGTRTFLPVEKQAAWNRHKELFAKKWGGTKWFCFSGSKKYLENSEIRKRIIDKLLLVARNNIAVLYLYVPFGIGMYFKRIHDSFRIVELPNVFIPIATLIRSLPFRNQKRISRIYVWKREETIKWQRLSKLLQAEVRSLSDEAMASP